LVGLTSILKEAWDTATNTQDKREKIQALSLAKECYGMKLDLLTNATVVDDAIRFVTSNANYNSSNIHGTSVHAKVHGQGQEEKEAVKPKTNASVMDSADEDSDIQRPQEETEHLPGDPTTTNSVF